MQVKERGSQNHCMGEFAESKGWNFYKETWGSFCSYQLVYGSLLYHVCTESNSNSYSCYHWWKQDIEFIEGGCYVSV